MRAARTADLVLARLFREPQNILALLATAVDVSFSVADTVALKAEKRLEILD